MNLEQAISRLDHVQDKYNDDLKAVIIILKHLLKPQPTKKEQPVKGTPKVKHGKRRN